MVSWYVAYVFSEWFGIIIIIIIIIIKNDLVPRRPGAQVLCAPKMQL